MEGFQTRLVNDKEEGIVDFVLSMQNFFPTKLNYGDWDVWDNLQNPRNINLLLENDGTTIGYCLAIPQDEAVDYLKKEDPLMAMDSEMYYVDQVVVIPAKRQRGAFKLLVNDLIKEAKKRGIKKLSSHLTTEEGLNRLILFMFNDKVTFTKRRMVKLPSYGDHLLEYFELTIN